ncbi:MAG TPA: hypothetical protein VKA80_05670 [Beijerinckiaceae bacterium]|nr:hypothetical protein [Beijerinckiaceae bacterium]
MRERFRRRTTVGVVAGVVAAFAVAGMASVGAAFSPAGPSASAKQYDEKVTICHRTGSKKNPFRTIRVSKNALKAHLKHSDAVGPCGPSAVFTMCHKTKNGKTKTVKVKGTRKAGRALKKGDKLGKCKAKGKPDKQKGKGKGKGKGKKK